jgi:hypothetical protein
MAAARVRTTGRPQSPGRTLPAMATTPPHLAGHRCYVCGGEPHADTTASGGHQFWSNAAAVSEFRERDLHSSAVYPGGVTMPEAAYVAEHRPY